MAAVLDGRTRPDLQQKESPRIDALDDSGPIRGEGGAPRADLPAGCRPGPRAGPLPTGLQNAEGPPEGESERPRAHPDDRSDSRGEDQGASRSSRGRKGDRRPSSFGGFRVNYSIAGARGHVADPMETIRQAQDWAGPRG